MLRSFSFSDPARPALRPLAAASLVTALAAALSWGLPSKHAATGVGLCFLIATWWLALRGDRDDASHYGLALGGLFEDAPLSARGLFTWIGRAIGSAALACAVIFPPYAFLYRAYGLAVGRAFGPFHFALPPHFADEAAGQVLVIALPEEAFFRGYLQTALDDAWPPRWRVLGARIGPSIFVTSAVFAFGHYLTDPRPERLAVFLPALLFGWLRARTGDIAPAVLFHAACNLFVQILEACLARGR